MPLVDVCSIFEAVKEEFLMGIPTDAIPVGVLLGGQGCLPRLSCKHGNDNFQKLS